MENKEMNENICNLKGIRYEGEFKGSKYQVEGPEKEYTNIREIYTWWEGIGTILDKEYNERYFFEFSDHGIFHRNCYSLENLIINFSDDVGKEVREEDREKLVDYVLESLVSEVKESKQGIPELILSSHPKKGLVERGLIPEKNGQVCLGIFNHEV